MDHCSQPPTVLFVCLGNICRSPLAEAAFRHEAERIGLSATIDSAGTGNWHVGHPPDSRARAEARRHGIDISGYRARQVTPADFDRFDWIVAMDRENLANLKAMAPPGGDARLTLLLDNVAGRTGESVADPYFGQAEGFERTWRDVLAGARGLAAKLVKQS
jgi:protein-tyrosine phosphatase